MIWLFFILFVVLLLLPFLPGYVEYIRKTDAAPLSVKMDYVKDPRYFSDSFKRIFAATNIDWTEIAGSRNVRLSKNELVEVREQAEIAAGETVKKVFFVKQNLVTGADVTFEKEIYAQGNVRIGERNELRALACDTEVRLGQGSRFVRWIDSDGTVSAGENCDLGISASSAGEFRLGSGCIFRRLYGLPVKVSPDGRFVETDGESPSDILEQPILELGVIERNPGDIKARTLKECSLICGHSLEIGEYAVIRGHIKTHGSLHTGTGVVITGNVFAEGDIEIGPKTQILGTVFTQGRVTLGEDSVVGQVGRIKSVVGKKGIILKMGATVHGHLVTEGEGNVV